MKLLVIGGAGYVGSILRPALEAAHECYHFDQMPIGGVADDHQIVADLNDDYALRLAVYRKDALLFLAMGKAPPMTTTAPHPVRDTDYAFDVNAKGYFRAVSAAMDEGIRSVVYASSLSVYRNRTFTRGSLDETVPPNGADSYGMTKRLGEEMNNVFAAAFPDATLVSLRLMWPRNEKDWSGNEFTPGRYWYPTGPHDLRRLFLAALECRRPGSHIVQATGDLEEHAFSHARVSELLDWKPEGR